MRKKINILILVLTFIVLLLPLGSSQLLIGDYVPSGASANLSALVNDGETQFRNIVYMFDTPSSGFDYLYATGRNTKLIYQFSIGELGLNSINYTGNFYNASSWLTPSGRIWGFYMHPLGNNAFFSVENGTIVRLSLSSNFDISTASVASAKHFDNPSSSADFGMKGLHLAPNAVLFYVYWGRAIGSSSNGCALAEYQLVNPYDITSAVLLGFTTANTTGSSSVFCRDSQSLWRSAGGEKYFIPAAGGGAPSPVNLINQYSALPNTIFNSISNITGAAAGVTIPVVSPHNVLWRLDSSLVDISTSVHGDSNLAYGNIITEYVHPAQQLATLPNITLGFGQTQQINFGTFFTSYQFPFVAVSNLDGSGGIFLQPGQSGTLFFAGNPQLVVNFTESENIVFTSTLFNGEFEYTLYACQTLNLTACITQTAFLTINQSFVPPDTTNPQLIGDMQDYAQAFNTSKIIYNVNDFFLNYGYIELQQGPAMITPGQNITGATFQVALSANGSILTQSFSTAGVFPINVLACEDATKANCVQDGFSVFVNQGGVLPSTPSGSQGGGLFVNNFLSIFPDADSLSFGQKMVYVFVTLFIIFIGVILFILISAMVVGAQFGEGLIKLSLISSFIFVIIGFFFFMSINYISTIFIVMSGIIGIGLAYLFFRGRGNGT